MVIWLDCETKKPVTPKNGQLEFGIEYAESWTDYKGMGISCCCVQTSDGTARVFNDDDLSGLQTLINYSDKIVTYNGDSFDLPLLSAHGLIIPPVKSLDLHAKIIEATGKRAKLEDVARRNLNAGKTGDGALAPILYQQGHIVELIDYCFGDVGLTYRLWKLIKTQGFLLNPYNSDKMYISI